MLERRRRCAVDDPRNQQWSKHSASTPGGKHRTIDTTRSLGTEAVDRIRLRAPEVSNCCRHHITSLRVAFTLSVETGLFSSRSDVGGGASDVRTRLDTFRGFFRLGRAGCDGGRSHRSHVRPGYPLVSAPRLHRCCHRDGQHRRAAAGAGKFPSTGRRRRARLVFRSCGVRHAVCPYMRGDRGRQSRSLALDRGISCRRADPGVGDRAAAPIPGYTHRLLCAKLVVF